MNDQVHPEEEAPLIPYVNDISNVSEELSGILESYNERMGFYPNALKLYLHRPQIAETLWALNNRIMRDQSSVLDQRLKRELGALASKMNSCDYCTTHNTHVLKRNSGVDAEGWDMPETDLDELLLGNKQGASAKDQVCYDFVKYASLDPGEVPEEIYDRMKEHLRPEEVIELAAVVGFWKMYNTIHDSLRVPIEQALKG